MLNKEEFVNKEEFISFLNTIRYPVYFLDCETVMATIPLYDGTSPFQQVPYQYSLHYLEHDGSEPWHYEFLAGPNIDPREEVAASPCSQIPDNACVLAYKAPFEIGILRQLGEDFPRYKQKLERIIGNTIDLAAPFRSRHIYHWEMKGSSYSQKVVLPLLVPDLSYKGLEIINGDGRLFRNVCQSGPARDLADPGEPLAILCLGHSGHGKDPGTLEGNSRRGELPDSPG